MRLSTHPRHRCGGVRQAMLAALLAAGTAGAARGAVTYTWTTFSPLGAHSWSDPSAWTVSGGPQNYPGGNAALLTDVVTIQPAGSMGGAYTINFTGMNAASVGSISLVMPGGSTAADTMTLNINSGTLAASGNMVFTSTNNSAGKATLNVLGTLTVGGTMTTSVGSTLHVANGGVMTVGGLTANAPTSGNTTLTLDNGGTMSLGDLSYSATANWKMSIGGNFTTTSFTTNSGLDAANITLTSTAQASLGNFTLSRSLGNNTLSASAPGLHVQGGTNTAADFIIGTNSPASAAIAEIAGGQLTVTGPTFAVGQSNANGTSPRSTIFVDGGSLIGTNSGGLVIGQTNTPQTSGTVSAGSLVVTSGTARLEKITLGGALATTSSSPGTNNGTLTIDGGSVYLGSGGLVGTAATAVKNVSMASGYAVKLGGTHGGTLGAKASWQSSANMTLQGTTPATAITFKTADENDNPFDITLTGVLSGAGGGFNKTGGGTLRIQALNTYAGPTNINEGKLQVTGSLSGSGVTVASGATLTGTGKVNANVLLNGILAPGLKQETIHIGGVLTFGSNSELLFELGPQNVVNDDTDLVSFNSLGNNLAGSNLGTLMLTGSIDYTRTYTIFDNTSTTGFTFANIQGYDSSHFVPLFGENGNNGYSLSFSPQSTVPEPAGLSILGLGMAGLLLRRRRSR
jgi:autotransporter-associated beta strand protein